MKKTSCYLVLSAFAFVMGLSMATMAWAQKGDLPAGAREKARQGDSSGKTVSGYGYGEKVSNKDQSRLSADRDSPSSSKGDLPARAGESATRAAEREARAAEREAIQAELRAGAAQSALEEARSEARRTRQKSNGSGQDWINEVRAAEKVERARVEAERARTEADKAIEGANRARARAGGPPESSPPREHREPTGPARTRDRADISGSPSQGGVRGVPGKNLGGGRYRF